ncbi:MAG: 3'-5' exonuclease [Candidatus Dormibacteria bacterium]
MTEAGTPPPQEPPLTSGQRRRRRHGRPRGPIPVGDSFVARLGPARGEPFASLEDIDDDATIVVRPTRDTPIDELRFVALDCETTGQSPHRLVELGAVAFTPTRHLMSFETLVHSTDRINPYAKRIHGIGSETLGGAPPVAMVLRRFRRFCQGAVLVEHSADAFDTRLIASTMETPLDADNLDTSRLAAALWGLRDTIGLERMCNELGVHHRRPHHALADAEATAECFVELLGRGRAAFAWSTLGDLLDVAQPPLPRTDEERRQRRGRGAGGGAAGSGRPRRRGGRRHRRPRLDQDGGEQGTPPEAGPA